MDESLICECGNENFWYFWEYVRCTKCFNEHKKMMVERYATGGFGSSSDGSTETYPEFWMRRFDKKKNQYHNNWEKSKLTYK